MKPILFNTEMVRAILDNRKTVTRRVVKPQEKIFKNLSFGYTAFTPNGHISVRGEWTDKDGNKRYGENFIKLPYRPGDILYVRETFLQTPDGQYWYKADNICNGCTEEGFCKPDGVKPQGTCKICGYYAGYCNIKWKPSIHMPREAARIFLRVTDVRVERLWDITDDGVEKEGVPILDRCEKEARCLQAFSKFQKVWDATLKPKDRALYDWGADPWVWVIEFEKISPEEAENGTH